MLFERLRTGLIAWVSCLVLSAGCATAPNSLGLDQLGRLRARPEIVVVHYEPPPLQAYGPPRGGLLGGIAEGLNVAAIILAPSAALLAGGMVSGEIARHQGEQLVAALGLEDPTLTVKTALIDRLKRDIALENLRPAARPLPYDRNTYRPDVIERLRKALGPVTALEFTAPFWNLTPAPSDPSRYRVLYMVGAAIWDLAEGDLLWAGFVQCTTLPSLYREIGAEGGARFRTDLKTMATECAGKLASQLAGGVR